MWYICALYSVMKIRELLPHTRARWNLGNTTLGGKVSHIKHAQLHWCDTQKWTKQSSTWQGHKYVKTTEQSSPSRELRLGWPLMGPASCKDALFQRGWWCIIAPFCNSWCSNCILSIILYACACVRACAFKLGIEPKASCMVSTHSTTEPHAQPNFKAEPQWLKCDICILEQHLTGKV